MQWFYGGGQKGWNWLTMPFGKHKGKTLPEVFFTDPSYIPWLLKREVIEQKGKYSRELAKQAKLIFDLTTYIIPAHAPRDSYEFLVLADSKNVLARVIAVLKGRSLPKKYKGRFRVVKRCYVLDAKIYDDFEQPRTGSERMGVSLRKTLFPYCPNPGAADFQRYMITYSNFAAKFCRAGVKSKKLANRPQLPH